ncbi:hypothetical protein ACLI08_07985 [Flavobacterium sp. RNTU_13]|uniref:hypothetical protein n=1 Tax=Flavobacterium sp. RNTU_13 TaxID=3375145 RepID=UPI003986E803
MKYEIKIPQAFPNHNELAEAVNHLVSFLHIDAVYVSPLAHKTLVSVIMSDSNAQDDDALHDSKLADDHPNIVFKYFSGHWVEHAYKKGFPYFIMHCNAEKLVYCLPEAKVFYPVKLKTKYYTYRLRKRTGEMIYAIDAYLRLYSDYMQNESHLEASYALHQGLRFIYMMISELHGEGLKGGQDLFGQYRWVADFAPSLDEIINPNTDEGKILLEFLNASRSAILSKSELEVNIDTLKEANKKVRQFYGEARSLYNKLYVDYKAKLKTLHQTETAGLSILEQKLPEDYFAGQLLHQINGIITGYIKTRAVFCFGYKLFNTEIKKTKSNYFNPSYHFYLLVYTLEPKDNPAAMIEAKVREAFGKKHKVTVLVHRKQSMSKKRDSDRWFFNKLTVNGFQVGSILNITDQPFERDLEYSVNYWRNRALLAESHLNTAKSLINPDDALLKNTLLHQAIVNSCLGFIELFLGYRPNRVNIGHLFALMQFITGKDFSLYFRQEDDNSLYLLLSANPDMIRYKVVNQYAIEDSNELELRCKDCFLELKQLAFAKLDELYKSHLIL